MAICQKCAQLRGDCVEERIDDASRRPVSGHRQLCALVLCTLTVVQFLIAGQQQQRQRQQPRARDTNSLCLTSAQSVAEIKAARRTGATDCRSGMGDSVQLGNPFLQPGRADVFYHFGLATDTHDLPHMFSDTKFVCMGGSSRRMKRLAEQLASELGIGFPTGQGLVNIIPNTDRFVMYKVGPIVCVNHGIGMPSISVVLHELTKILEYTGCTDVTFFRIGTSGGVGVSPGTVCITERCYDTQFRPYYEQFIMGQKVQRPAVLDQSLTQELVQLAEQCPHIRTVSGATLCTGDFYEEQGRTDGALCEHTEEQKRKFLQEAFELGIRNIEMESLAFAAFTNRLRLKAACMAVTLVDRFQTDKVTHSPEVINQWELQTVKILSAFIMKRMGTQNLELKTAVCPNGRRRGTSDLALEDQGKEKS